MKYGPPGVTSERAAEILAGATHDPSKAAEHLPQGGIELKRQQEDLRDLISDERRNLSAVRRNI